MEQNVKMEGILKIVRKFICVGDSMEITLMILMITMTKTIKLLLPGRRVVEIGCKLGEVQEGGGGGLGRPHKLISPELLRTHSLPSLYSYPLQPLEQACLWHRIKICLHKALNPRRLAYPRRSRMKCAHEKKTAFQNVINNS
jgi:hypothetical protein